MSGLRGRRLPVAWLSGRTCRALAFGAGALVAALLLLLAAAGPAAGQFAATEEIIEKPSKEGEGRKLDASGLTTGFALLVGATRSVDRAEVGGGEVVVNAGRVPLNGVDWLSFREHEQGLLEFETFAAIKLRTEDDILLGDLPVPAGNVSPGFAGLYSLWLHLDEDGRWTLIVNHEPDIWGTMHDPARDLGRTPLEYSTSEDAKPRLTIEIEAPEGDGPGTLKLSWGGHRWRTTVAAAG